MKAIPMILLVIILWIYLNIEISSQNPCSIWSANQSLCTSDNYVK
jgi:hypothetical protein